MSLAKIKNTEISNVARALRLPFLSASILPFIFGSVSAASKNFLLPEFILGLLTVVFTHLGANLINDYADSKSGVDWQDQKFYGFFGGSKLIQENVFKEKFYLGATLFCFFVASAAVFILSAILETNLPLIFYSLIVFLGFYYSHKPLQFSYRRLGEPVIFILFGPALVVGGYFIQSRIFLDFRSLILSLPSGFLIMAILFANEIPDYQEDKKCGKLTWVSLTGPERAYIIYALMMLAAFLAIALNIRLGYISNWGYLSFLFVLPVIKAASVLKRDYTDKIRLVHSSKLTIMAQILVTIILIIGAISCKRS